MRSLVMPGINGHPYADAPEDARELTSGRRRPGCGDRHGACTPAALFIFYLGAVPRRDGGVGFAATDAERSAGER